MALQRQYHRTDSLVFIRNPVRREEKSLGKYRFRPGPTSGESIPRHQRSWSPSLILFLSECETFDYPHRRIPPTAASGCVPPLSLSLSLSLSLARSQSNEVSARGCSHQSLAPTTRPSSLLIWSMHEPLQLSVHDCLDWGQGAGGRAAPVRSKPN